MKNYVSIRTQVIHGKSPVSDSPSRFLGFGDDKHSHKPSKSSLSRDGEKKKSSKMASVIPSKDKSLHSQSSSTNNPTLTSGQPSSSLSSSSYLHSSQNASYHEKSVNASTTNIPQPSSSSQSLQDPFTDLFGTPIKARPSPDSIKFKDSSKSGLSSHKSSTKKISSSDHVKSSSDLISKSSSSSLSSEKERKHKLPSNGTNVSSKDIKEIKCEKDTKPFNPSTSNKDKSLKKRNEEFPKIKKEKSSSSKSSFDGRPTTPNLSATSSSSSKKLTTSSSLSNLSSIKREAGESITGGGVKESSTNSSSSSSSNKKRKRSLSPPSFSSASASVNANPSNLTNEKKMVDGESLIKSSSKDGLSEKSHKEKSKKQKASSRDQVSTSATTGSNSNHKVKDVKKESSTSTTISLTNNENTGTTTLEIKSVKKEKTWDSEIKKSRSKEHKTDEVKSSRENVSKDFNKVQVRDKEVLKEKEKELTVGSGSGSGGAGGVERKEKEKSKDKSSKSRDKDKDRDKEKEKKLRGRSNEKDAIHDELFSPQEPVCTSKYSKSTKDKYLGANLNPTSNINNNINNLSAHVNSLRETSSSPGSIVSGSLTPGGGAYLGAPSSVSSLNGPITTLMAEMDQESLPVSPLSSCDPPSPLTFGSKDKVTTSDDDSNPPIDHKINSNNNNNNRIENSINSNNSNNNSLHNNNKSYFHGNQRRDITVREDPPPPLRNNYLPEKTRNRDLPTGIVSKKRKDISSSSSSINAKPYLEPIDDPMESQHLSPKPAAISRGPPISSAFDYDYISQLKALHRKINDLRDRDILQRIVDIIEETGLFNMTNSAFDFDLMQLDRNTVRKIRQCLIST